MNKKIILFGNDSRYVANLRKELIEKIINEGFSLAVCTPFSKDDILLEKLKCDKISVNYNVHSMNPVHDIILFFKYYKILKKIKPEYAITFTVKPNIYVSLACRILKIKCLSNITGLGPVFEKGILIKSIVLLLYKCSMKRKGSIFFQNKSDMEQLLENNIGIGKNILLPGSGVNVDYFKPLPYPSDKTVEFVFIARVMKQKGIDQYLDAAKYIRNKYSQTRFHICGFCEDGYEDILRDLEEKGIIKYHGLVDDVREILKITHCTIHPTYYPEGMSNVLLESCACARPIITTDRSGCKEIVDDGVTGFIVKEKDEKDLISKIETFLKLDYISKITLGLNGRNKVEKEFDREIVVDKYLEELG